MNTVIPVVVVKTVNFTGMDTKKVSWNNPKHIITLYFDAISTHDSVYKSMMKNVAFDLLSFKTWWSYALYYFAAFMKHLVTRISKSAL